MIKQYQINTDLKSHAILAAIISFWLVAFLILISPFDASDLSFGIRLVLMPTYGLIFFISYMIGYYLQSLLYKKTNSWNHIKEGIVILVIYIITFLISWIYYRGEWVNGDYDFSTFGLNVFLPIGFILNVGFIFGRIYLNKRLKKTEKEKITLKGNNQKEVIKTNPENIICVSGAQNYVEVHLLEGDQLKKVLLRNTLKNIHRQCEHLITVHRSYLVNPEHFTRWKNRDTAIFYNVEIPVSKKYKDELEKNINHHP